jgi:hypothetical protein
MKAYILIIREVLGCEAQETIQLVPLHEELQLLVQGEQDPLHERHLAGENTLREELRMEDRKRSIKSTNSREDVKLDLFPRDES